MDDVRKIQVKDTAAFRKAVAAEHEFVLFEGDEPVARVLPIAQELAQAADRFKFYPHDAAECLYTCWRHPRVPLEQTADAEPVAADLAATE